MKKNALSEFKTCFFSVEVIGIASYEFIYSSPHYNFQNWTLNTHMKVDHCLAQKCQNVFEALEVS